VSEGVTDAEGENDEMSSGDEPSMKETVAHKMSLFSYFYLLSISSIVKYI